MSTVSPSVSRCIRAAVGALVLMLFVALMGAHATDASAAPSGSAKYAGGNKVPAATYPFVAGLRTPGNTRFFCTGTLVNKRWILTAAHCVDAGKQPNQVQVVIGDTDLNTSSDPAEAHTIDRIRIHERWGGDAGDSHDVAMLHLTADSALETVQLSRSKALTDGMKRCRQLGQSNWFLGYMCPAGSGAGVGWGRTPSTGDNTSTTLQRASATILGTGPSNTFWRTKSGACPGDSGGPLLITGDDLVVRQIGVASYIKHGWGNGGWCERKGTDYYSDVSEGVLRYFVNSTITPPQPTGPAPGSCPPYKPCADPDVGGQNGSGPLAPQPATTARG